MKVTSGTPNLKMCGSDELSEDKREMAACPSDFFDWKASSLVQRKVSELSPLAGLVELNFVPAEGTILETAKRCPVLWNEPITVTQNNEVVDRYDIFELARRQKREKVLCLPRDLTGEEASQLMLQAQLGRSCINPRIRILIALALLSGSRDRGKLNQETGGKLKGLSRLTEASRVDCRLAASKLAGVGTGQVTKVQQLEETAIDAVKAALSCSQITIHAAWKLRKLSSDEQLSCLENLLKRKARSQRRFLHTRRAAKLSLADRAFVNFNRALTELGGFPEYRGTFLQVTSLASVQSSLLKLGGND
jgi:hypothetical protein